jgi:hypothetical protein
MPWRRSRGRRPSKGAGGTTIIAMVLTDSAANPVHDAGTPEVLPVVRSTWGLNP